MLAVDLLESTFAHQNRNSLSRSYNSQQFKRKVRRTGRAPPPLRRLDRPPRQQIRTRTSVQECVHFIGHGGSSRQGLSLTGFAGCWARFGDCAVSNVATWPASKELDALCDEDPRRVRFRYAFDLQSDTCGGFVSPCDRLIDWPVTLWRSRQVSRPVGSDPFRLRENKPAGLARESSAVRPRQPRQPRSGRSDAGCR
jgi:hypothetical protein